MYDFILYSCFLKKFITLLLTITLLSVSFSFNFDKNITQELNTLYEATSVCEYYNTITNLSYSIINKILESTNINLTTSVSQRNEMEKKEKEEKEQSNKYNLYFVKTTFEKEVKYSKIFNNYKFSIQNILLLNKLFYFNLLSSKFLFTDNIFKLSYIAVFFCYLARDNIEGNLNINNIIREVRLV